MQELFSNAVKARIYLNKINQIEEALIDVIRSNRITKSERSRISELYDLLRFCEREDKELDLVTVLIDEMKANRMVSSKDIVKLTNIIHECKNELTSFVDEAFEEELARSMVPEREFTEYFAMLKNYVTEEISLDKEIKKKEVRRIIYNYPGHYIQSLYRYLQKKFSGEGFAYTTVLNYVNELVDEEEIITIGGPQGKFRYCFPNPKKITDRANYYNKYFGIIGTVKEKVTRSFSGSGWQRKYYNFYVINHSLVPEYILAVNFKAHIPQNSELTIRAYGDLEPFSYLEEKEGYILKNGLEEMDVLFARRVAKVIKNREEEVWSEPGKALLKVPTTLV